MNLRSRRRTHRRKRKSLSVMRIVLNQATLSQDMSEQQMLGAAFLLNVKSNEPR